MNTTMILCLYFSFVVVAVALNVLVQHLVFFAWPYSHAILVAMPTGAVAAVLAKYFLDRNFIFAQSKPAQRHEFVRYALTGGLITMCFFIVQYIIWSVYQTALARDIGIVLGMLIGYLLKYFIDKRFVFQRQAGALSFGN